MMEAYCEIYFGTLDSGKRRTKLKSSSRAIQNEYYSIRSQRFNKPYASFLKPENQAKNRNLQLLCWDHSRVVLDAKNGESDFIHANWIDGFEEPKKFIATQGPLANTTADFWKVIWQQHCHVIVMLTPTFVNGEEKCHQYWCPIENGSLVADGYEIETLKVTTRTNYITTLIRITNKFMKESRELTHFQCKNLIKYNSSSDFSWFVDFIERINTVRRAYMELSLESEKMSPCPIVVHCSSGVCSTGIFCAVDICLNQVKKTSQVSIFKAVSRIREQRYASVSSLKQYMIIYQVVGPFLKAQKNSSENRNFWSRMYDILNKYS